MPCTMPHPSPLPPSFSSCWAMLGPCCNHALSMLCSRCAAQADLRGLERAFDALPQQAQQPQHTSAGHPSSSLPAGASAPAASSASVQGASRRSLDGLTRQETPPDPRRALMRDRRAAAWRLLTTVEKDAVIVLSAMCKVWGHRNVFFRAGGEGGS